MNGILADGPAYLGAACAPFDPQGPAKRNMTLETKLERLTDRRTLLEGLDRFHRDADATGLMEGLDEFEDQAFNLILGNATNAFDVSKEDPRLVAKYDKGLGQQMLIARRLCEAGLRIRDRQLRRLGHARSDQERHEQSRAGRRPGRGRLCRRRRPTGNSPRRFCW